MAVEHVEGPAQRARPLPGVVAEGDIGAVDQADRLGRAVGGAAVNDHHRRPLVEGHSLVNVRAARCRTSRWR